METKNVKKIVVHCSATKPAQDIGAKEITQWHTGPKLMMDGSYRYKKRYYDAIDELPEEVQGEHRRGNGWSDIGYHFVIRRSGRIEPGRQIDVEGAHVRGHNDNSIGVCMVGGLNERGEESPDFTSEQFDSLVYLVFFLLLACPEAEVLGHRDLNPDKGCPCFDVKDFLEGISMGYEV